MKTRLTFLSTLIVLFVLCLAGCVTPAAPNPSPTTPPPPTPLPPTSPPPTPTPEPLPTDLPVSQPTRSSEPHVAVIQAMIERFNAGDLEGVKAYWPEDTRVYFYGLPPTGTEVYLGWEAVRPVWEENIASHLVWEFNDPVVSGNVVSSNARTWHDFTRSIGVAPVEASEIYVVEDGKIASYTWTIAEESLGRLKAALAEAMPPETPAPPAPVTPASEITITYSGGTCTYDGPLALQAGEVRVTWNVQDDDRELYALTFFTLDEGKDFMDLMASTVQPVPPGWSDMIEYWEQRGDETGDYSMMVSDGPVYAICWSRPPDQPIGAIGPFTVAP